MLPFVRRLLTIISMQVSRSLPRLTQPAKYRYRHIRPEHADDGCIPN